MFFTSFPDGRHLTMWQDQKRTCEEIAKFSRNDAVGVLRLPRIRREARAIRGGHAVSHAAERGRNRMELSFDMGKLGLDLMHMPDEERVGNVRIFTQSVAESSGAVV